MNAHAAAPFPDDLREALARALYALERDDQPALPAWDDATLDLDHPGLRQRCFRAVDALAAGPLARVLAQAAERSAADEELRVLRRQRMAPERERELLDANNRLLARAEAAEATLARTQRERDVAREAEGFWQLFAFDADDLATQRLIEQTEARAAADRDAIKERCLRERAESALRLFADRADVMPKEGWASDLTKANRDIPLWWFHAARVALTHPEVPGDPAEEAS